MKKELQEEYEKYININSDEYSKAVVEASENVMKLLDENKTSEEAIEGLKGFGLTGYMAGVAIQTVVYFHERGEEIKKVWNKQNGAEDATGIVNPALITINNK
jgi:hypothetical protein